MPVAGDPPASGASLLPGALAMDDRADSLLMTVHLLADSGRSSLLQQALDRLLAWICPDVRLFLVSERATPLKYYERYCRRSRGFPGMAVLLFLHEDLGAEGILQVRDIFQHPPWRYQRVEVAPGPSHPYGPARHDFYTLDEHMPVWGVRRARRGPEVLRVTLYCSWDNYEDAVRLYETILREEAAAREGERFKATPSTVRKTMAFPTPGASSVSRCQCPSPWSRGAGCLGPGWAGGERRPGQRQPARCSHGHPARNQRPTWTPAAPWWLPSAPAAHSTASTGICGAASSSHQLPAGPQPPPPPRTELICALVLPTGMEEPLRELQAFACKHREPALETELRRTRRRNSLYDWKQMCRMDRTLPSES